MNVMIEEREICGKRTCTAENHHESLLSWSRIRRSLKTAPSILVLDHHTDTLPAFHHAPGKACSGSWKSDAEIETVIERLHHDEQFDFAVRNDVLSNAVFFTHENFSIEHDSRLCIFHEDPDDLSIDGKGRYYAEILESRFLRKYLDQAAGLLPERGYVLDIDLDCFKGKKSIQPDDPDEFFRLVRNSCAITICPERDWVRLLNLDYDRGADWEFFYNELMNLIQRALSGE